MPLAVLRRVFGPESVYRHRRNIFQSSRRRHVRRGLCRAPYISQEAVYRYGWLKPAEMLDGLGMAETTPGPLIMVVQFVGR